MTLRRALLIGCSNYRSGFELITPHNDVELLGCTLSQRRFQCHKLLDPEHADIQPAIDSFSSTIADAELALIFFAGHAYEHAGTGTILPTDFPFPVTGGGLHYSGYPVSSLERAFSTCKGAGVLILDACRVMIDSQEERRRWTEEAVRSGTAASPSNLLVAWSTSPGMVAWDGTDGHSRYARSLAKFALHHGQGLEETFTSVGKELQDRPQEQRSWYRSSLNSRYSLSDIREFSFGPSVISPLPARQGSLSLSRDHNRSRALIYGRSRSLFEITVDRQPNVRRTHIAPKEVAAADWLANDIVTIDVEPKLEFQSNRQSSIALQTEPYVVRSSPNGSVILLLGVNSLTLVKNDGEAYIIVREWNLDWSPYGVTFQSESLAWVVGSHAQIGKICFESCALNMLTEPDLWTGHLYDVRVVEDRDLAIVGSDGMVRLIRPGSGAPIALSKARTLKEDSLTSTKGVQAFIVIFTVRWAAHDLLFCDTAPHQPLLAVGDDQGDVHLIDLRSGAVAQHLPFSSGSGSVQGLAFFQDGSLIALGYDATVRIARQADR